MFADCDELTALRAGGAKPSHFGSYISAYYPASYVGHFEDLPRARAVAYVSEELRNSDPTEPSLASNPYFLATRARRELGQERLEYLGVLGTDDTALYFGTLESVANGEHVLATVSGLTTVGGWLIGINISAPYQGGATIDMLLKQQQVNIQRLIDTNSSSPAGK